MSLDLLSNEIFIGYCLAVLPVLATVCFTAREKRKETQVAFRIKILEIAEKISLTEENLFVKMTENTGVASNLPFRTGVVGFYFNYLEKLVNRKKLTVKDIDWNEHLKSLGIKNVNGIYEKID